MKLPFDEIYCLVLAGTDREQHIKNEIAKLGIESQVKIWYTSKKNAITNKIAELFNDLKTDFYDDVFKYNKNVYGNVFDCSYNHYSIIKQAYERGLNNILIFEDDAKFNEDHEKIKYIMDNIPNNYILVKFHNGWCPEPEGKNMYIDKNHWSFSLYRYSTLCYAINRDGMKYIIEEYEKDFGIADIVLDRIKDNINNNIYVLRTNEFCTINNNKSNIIKI